MVSKNGLLNKRVVEEIKTAKKYKKISQNISKPFVKNIMEH